MLSIMKPKKWNPAKIDRQRGFAPSGHRFTQLQANKFGLLAQNALFQP
ncbi:hypothetical protein GJ746_21740 [Klebsiella oxytoca]|uniref:Uncharacterized protein n=1 Tax=Klebsiella oxytoca TaxID=571 RepID=A0A6B8N2D3_KLEOX|nr:hypothetical protein GJ746_21740 [Klebsiella oxytoca]